MRIKVCGIKETDNASEVAALSPDYMGFIFYAGSPRYVGDSPDYRLFDAAGNKVKKIGVFVNEEEERAEAIASAYEFDGVQLHGEESPEYCYGLVEMGLTVIKAFGVDEAFDFARTEKYRDACHYFLFDTRTKKHGGSGRRFDWTLLKEYDNSMPFFLSGGIGPENANDIMALKDFNIHAVDVNSRFEAAPGIKDVERLKKFMDRVRNNR